MNSLNVIFKRELASYFATPLAYIFIVIFLVLSAVFTFYLGGFYEGGQADLVPFFNFHPWLYLFLVPAVAMRLWAEERKSGTIELLMTLPVSRADMVLGKFLHQWLILTVEVDMVMFDRVLDLSSYLWAAVLTVVFSLAVNLTARRKLRDLDMVEALKSVE